MTTTIMGMSVTSASVPLPSSSSTARPVLYALSSSNCSVSMVSQYKVSNFSVSIRRFPSWSGLKHLGISLASSKSLKLERKRRCRGMGVRASLFGVGAPEALVIGVVALLVFGPKGLAEVARNLGKTLRAFQPTIKELQEVSREFKSTLEKEIGLDDINAQNTYNLNRTNSMGSSSPSSAGAVGEKPQDVADPNGTASPTKAYSSEDYLKVTEEQLKAAAAAQQPGQTSIAGKSQPEFPSTPQAQAEETTSTDPPSTKSENNT